MAKEVKALMEKEKIMLDALADIASNLGRGSIRPSEAANAADPLRARATDALQKAGYNYYENVGIYNLDGWFTEEQIAKYRAERKAKSSQLSGDKTQAEFERSVGQLAISLIKAIGREFRFFK